MSEGSEAILVCLKFVFLLAAVLVFVLGPLFVMFVLLFSQSVSSYSRDILRALPLYGHAFRPHADPGPHPIDMSDHHLTYISVEAL